MRRYLVFFALLYFIQGAALAYIIGFQKPFLAAHGVSKETLGLFTSLLILPFIFKVFFGMLSDRLPLTRFGPRKPLMVVGLLLFSVCYYLLSRVVDPGAEFLRFAWLSWLASLGLALFDTCADGWAVDMADESEQSAIQASMIAGKSAGLIGTSYLFGILSEGGVFSPVFRVLSMMSLLVLLLVLLVPYKRRVIAETARGVTKNWRILTRPFYLFFASFAVLYSMASFGADGLWSLYLSEAFHAGSRELGNFGMARGVGALIGAGLYVLVQSRIGLLRSQVTALVFLGLGCLLALSGAPVWLCGCLWGACWGFQETAFVTLAMRYAEGPWAATFFAVSMIFSNVGTSLGEALAAPLVPHLGFTGVFLVLAALAWTSLLLVRPMFEPILRKSAVVRA